MPPQRLYFIRRPQFGKQIFYDSTNFSWRYYISKLILQECLHFIFIYSPWCLIYLYISQIFALKMPEWELANYVSSVRTSTPIKQPKAKNHILFSKSELNYFFSYMLVYPNIKPATFKKNLASLATIIRGTHESNTEKEKKKRKDTQI